MLTKGDLKKIWKGLSDDTEIFVMSDHGQTPESANFINYSNTDKTTIERITQDHDEEIEWDGSKEIATAILIS